MPKPARRPKEPGVGSAERLGTGGSEESRAHKATGRATKPQDGWKELGERRRAEGCRKGGSAGRPRGPQDDRRTGRGQDLRITPETGSARWPKGRRSPQSGWKEPGGRPRAAPRGDRIREATGAQDDRRGRGRDPGLAGEPRSGPRARPDPQGARKRSRNPRKGPELRRKARDHARGTSRSKLPARSEKKRRGAGGAGG